MQKQFAGAKGEFFLQLQGFNSVNLVVQLVNTNEQKSEKRRAREWWDIVEITVKTHCQLHTLLSKKRKYLVHWAKF